ncbi:hypothetical protein BLNAU_21551 [Blattamonas nauphoetae]|uniref:Uncharacterized protein n=1 Tax=Blattamonas nauphoetae TaxID=2049346 RepID=A0ABQ9WVK5_9EUKA|nr:hypothetical protein BLNAU_21551 [Blattamonas nauphoetae]
MTECILSAGISDDAEFSAQMVAVWDVKQSPSTFSSPEKAPQRRESAILTGQEVISLINLCKGKIHLAKAALPALKQAEAQSILIGEMMPYCYLMDILRAKNLDDVLSMPYLNSLCPHTKARDVIEMPRNFAISGLTEDEVIRLIVPGSELIDRIITVSATQANPAITVDEELISRNYPHMGHLAVVYAYAKCNPETCVLPFVEGVETWAMPSGIPMESVGGPNAEMHFYLIPAPVVLRISPPSTWCDCTATFQNPAANQNNSQIGVSTFLNQIHPIRQFHDITRNAPTADPHLMIQAELCWLSFPPSSTLPSSAESIHPLLIRNCGTHPFLSSDIAESLAAIRFESSHTHRMIFVSFI